MRICPIRQTVAMRVARQLLRLGWAVLAFIALYATAAVVGGLVPVNRAFVQDGDGVTIYLRTNGIHAEIAVPIVSRVADWRPEFEPPPPVPGAAAASYVSFGWGNRDFYLQTRRWQDARPHTALFALAGIGGAAMHVDFVHGPSSAFGHVVLNISEDQYARLTAYIRRYVTRDDSDRPVLIEGHTYGHGDRFYEAEGHYSLAFTCNEWLRSALQEAGIRTASWAPLDAAIFYQLETTK